MPNQVPKFLYMEHAFSYSLQSTKSFHSDLILRNYNNLGSQSNSHWNFSLGTIMQFILFLCCSHLSS